MSASASEHDIVEQPFIAQLVSMGWKHITGNDVWPTVTGRGSFRQVLLEDDLRKALRRINLDDQGQPWLDEARISQALSALTRVTGRGLLEINQMATQVLLEGASVEGLEHWNQGRGQTVRFIDWEHPDSNEFLVIDQFRVDEPGGQGRQYIEPDLVLFVNGIPLAVVECKAPDSSEPAVAGPTRRSEIVAAVDQLRRYSNQRERFEQEEGNEELFHTNQLLVATCFHEARMGTIGGAARHFKEWKDTSPISMTDVAKELGKKELSSQEKLVAGALRPAHLLDLIRHFTLFKEEDGGQTVKTVCRYQQFRAVHAAIERLRKGQTRIQDGHQDRRGGIIWHTQGSGKSLTMVYLVRKMRSEPDLRTYKVVVITDRTDLQKQLASTAALSGEVVKVARKMKQLEPLLANDTPDMVFAMIQKYQERGREDEETTGTGEETPDFQEINRGTEILVLVDEAHRSHSSNALEGNFGSMHQNLRQALPNAAMIGFTGTPILMGSKKRTHEIFGSFIDKYTIRQSEEDGATVPIRYELRTAGAKVENAESLDQVFEDFFKERTREELEAIKAKYATKGNVLEAEKLIAEKAQDMLQHYLENVLPNEFKAQVVASSRRAAVRYQSALIEARDRLVKAIEGLDPGLLLLDAQAVAALDPKTRRLVRAHRQLGLLRALEFGVVISAGDEETPGWQEWTDEKKVAERIRRFKRPLGLVDNSTQSPLAFLIVKSMLLTGFDAPVEQVMYLDRPIKEAELLQAVARVNRSGPPRKHLGLVVDYYGVARHLDEALQKYYEAEDITDALKGLEDDLPRLREMHRAVVGVFQERGLLLSDLEGCVVALASKRLRGTFYVRLRQFLVALDAVLPRLAASPFIPDAEALIEIQFETNRRYRVGGPPAVDPEDGAKVAALLDRHLASRGIDLRIAPINILDARFTEHVRLLGTDRTRASEMEHAARHHMREHRDQDPVRFEKLSARLEAILKEFAERWAELVQALAKFIEELRAGRQEDASGLDPKTQVPFLDIIRRAVLGDEPGTQEQLEPLCRMTVALVEHIHREVRASVDFWRNPHRQDALRKDLCQLLDSGDVIPFEKVEALADQLMELARKRRSQFEAQ